MSRPIYETEEDLANEREILSNFPEYEWHKMPISYRLDYIGFGPKRKRIFAEAKDRKNPMEQYPTYMIGLSKIVAAINYNQTLGLDSVLIVRWTCGNIGWTHIHNLAPNIGWGGRTDRGDKQDQEPVAWIPMDNFTLLEETR